MDPSESEDSDASESLTPSLEAAMPPEQRLSTQERLRLARRRRSEQLKKWAQREREWQQHQKPEKTERITFIANVMLLEAAARNDLSEVRRLLETGVSPDSTNEDGLTALHQCCIDDSEEMMKLLIQYGGNPNATDTEKWTPLHAAATCGHLHLVKFLIDAGAELLSVNADGNMPYDLCEDDTTLSYIENEMARRGVTQELIDDTRSRTERHMLSDLVAYQAQNGDLEIRDAQGATPLHIASANGYLSVVEFLLDHHASTEVVDDDLWQPLHAAACWGHLEVVEMLAQNGANVSAKTRNGETPFDICEDPDIKERLLELKEQRMQLGQPRVKRTRSQSTRTQSIRRTSLRDKMNTTKRDVQDEKLYFIQSIDGQKQQTNIPSQNGHSRRDHDSPEKDIVDIKDVELTLLPSYLQGEQDSNKNNAVIDNTDLLQNISKPNPQLSPPKRPPRTSQSPDGPIERVNVQVNVNTAQASMNHAPSAGSGGASASSNADAINAAQTLSDLKKQRSMHRVAQQSPRSSDNQRDNHGQGQHHQRGNSNSSSSHHSSKQKTKEDNNHRHSSKRNSKNGSSRNGHRSSANVKKFASPTEVVGPSPKKVGCCRVM